MKKYLDELPEFNAIIKEFIADLEPDYSEGCLIQEIEAIECRSRDGFIPHSHNYGGYDKQWITNLMTIWGSGTSLNEYTPEIAHDEYKEAVETFFKYDASQEIKNKVKDIPANKLNYHDLNELGHADIAETLDEYCMEWLNTDSIYYGFRAMYEGQNEAWHTIVLYAAANRSEYHGAFGGETLGEFEVKFRNAKELETKLNAIKDDLQVCI